MRILVVEECRRCGACGEVTPHSRRRLPRRVAPAAGAMGLGACLATLGGAGVLMGSAFGLVALLSVLRERRSLWRIACERCRGKEWARRRAAWRGLSSTEISV